MEVKQTKMVQSDDSVYKKVIPVNDVSGELKTQYSIDLTSWDSSKMDGYVEGSEVRKGHSCKIATLKVNKKYPKNRIDIDPSNVDLRQAISEMYKAYDEVVKQK